MRVPYLKHCRGVHSYVSLLISKYVSELDLFMPEYTMLVTFLPECLSWSSHMLAWCLNIRAAHIILQAVAQWYSCKKINKVQLYHGLISKNRKTFTFQLSCNFLLIKLIGPTIVVCQDGILHMFSYWFISPGLCYFSCKMLAKCLHLPWADLWKIEEPLSSVGETNSLSSFLFCHIKQ